jgi:hypothetical protein
MMNVFRVALSRRGRAALAPALRWIQWALLLPAIAMASGGGGDSMVLVVDPRQFSGLRALWANLYNESHLSIALLTILIIPALGLLMGKITDLVLAAIGINLKSRVLAED